MRIINLLHADKFLTVPLTLTIFCILFLTILFTILTGSLPQKMPLYYSLSWGAGQLAEKQQLFILPAIVAMITLLNLGLYTQLHTTQLILKRMLLLNILAVNLIIFLSALKIISNFI
ncbi:MAG: hypothetical protein Q7R49_01085 [Candidatus Daviesbacteria bacterium]|nr:hypothetical protein [Candidatus Daviesbacteria bacterium]